MHFIRLLKCLIASLGFLIRSYQDQHAQLQKLARLMKFRLSQVFDMILSNKLNKDNDQTALIHKLVCALLV